MILRDYQARAIEQIREVFRQGKRSVVLVAPTGSGKTVLAASMIQGAIAKNSACLFLAGRRELVTQCSRKLDDLQVEHGIVMADHGRAQPWSRVQVASVPTLARRLGGNKWRPEANLIFIDECHHLLAKSWHTVLDFYPGAVVVGLTATPMRLDGQGLGEFFQEMVVAAKPSALLAQGSLVPAVGFSYRAPEIADLKVQRSGDYSASAVSAKVRAVQLMGDIVSEWQKHAQGLRTVAFAVDVAYSQELAAQFVAAGVRAEHVDAETPTGTRDAVLERLRLGETQVVCNVGLFSEGFDLPSLECAILARPTASEALALQMVGRILRPCCLVCGYPTPPQEPRCLNAACLSDKIKRRARIHDHARVLMLHGLPDEDREFDLDGCASRREKNPRSCPKCFCVNKAGAQRCSECGSAFPASRGLAPDGRAIEIVEGEQVALEDLRRMRSGSQSHTVQDRAAEYHRLCAEAQSKGFAEAWIVSAYRARYGRAPNFPAALLAAMKPKR